LKDHCRGFAAPFDDYAIAHESDNTGLDEKRNGAMDMHNNTLGWVLAQRNSPDRQGKKHNDAFFCTAAVAQP
jgi:hypothetical protein